MPAMILLLILAGIALALVLWAVGGYNSLVSSREMVRNAMGQIAAQVESRWDAVQNLIDAAKQYASFEAGTLEEITRQRAALGTAPTVGQVEKDDSLFSSALSRLVALAENYPQLRTSEVYQNAMTAVDKYENNVRQSRMLYNDSVTRYNRTIQQVPTNILAGMFGFAQEGYFQNTAEKAQVPSWK